MNELRYYFKKIHLQMDAGFNRACRKYGLTSSQFEILMYLAQENGGRNTLTDIAAHLNVRHTSVIHVLKLLDKKGLISKDMEQGTRCRPIFLTENGRQLIRKMMEKNPLLDQIMFDGLSQDELKLLEKMLKRIYQNLDTETFKNL